MKHGRMSNKRLKQMMHDLGMDETFNENEAIADQQQDEVNERPFDNDETK
ncbi:hypothetical protein [Thaumasiovibrio sp. DFM-14]